jgi:hypothetical protein
MNFASSIVTIPQAAAFDPDEKKAAVEIQQRLVNWHSSNGG